MFLISEISLLELDGNIEEETEELKLTAWNIWRGTFHSSSLNVLVESSLFLFIYVKSY